MEATVVASQLGGRRLGSGGFICRCPVLSHGIGRGDIHPSLSIADGERGILVHCFGGCDPRDVLDALRGLGLLDASDTRRPDRHNQRYHRRQDEHVRVHHPDAEAFRLWKGAASIPGSLAERYLIEHRGLAPPFPPSLRFTPSLRYPPSGLHFPALLAAVQAPDRRIVAVQATFLRPSDARKAPLSSPRWTFGQLGAGAVRLGRASSVLAIAEGVEDGLSAMEQTGCPCWVTLGAQRMHKVEIPPDVHELHVFADDDVSGRDAARLTAEHHRVLGCTVITRYPPAGCKDWGDVPLFRASEVAA